MISFDSQNNTDLLETYLQYNDEPYQLNLTEIESHKPIETHKP